MPCYEKNLALGGALSTGGFRDRSQCQQSPCDSSGLCCYGSAGVSSGRCRCYEQPPLGGVFVPGETTCCPTCGPYVYNVLTSKYDGGCCRENYITDGHGACCPPGRDCCGNVSTVRTDGANGACCPESKPYCCRDPLIPEENRTGRCQQWPRAYDSTEVFPVLGSLDGCADQGALQKTITLPESPFTVDLVAECAINFFGANARYTARFVFGSFEWAPVLDGIGPPRNKCSGAGFANFCKPAGLTTATLIVEDLVTEFGSCDRQLAPVSAYSLRIFGKNPCECNPLP